MSEKSTLKARTENHSDVADTAPARALQEAQTSRQFGELLVRRLRDEKADVILRNFREEWVSIDDGMVFELAVDIQPAE